MSSSSIEGKLKVLEERLENEKRNRKDGFHNQGVLGTPKLGSQRPRPPLLFSSKEISSFPPRSPHAAETENKMKEVYKVSGKLNVDGVEYRSLVQDLQQIGELGSGTCGHVVKMRHRPSGAVIAVKQMRRSGNCEETKRILMDLDVVVRSHDCPYIVRCLGCFVTDAEVWICMELMALCFDKLLKKLGAPIPEPILGKVTVATVNALSYLKDTHGVIHRDVKPSNILLDERGNIKLCDFGISGRLVDSKAKTRSAGCAAYMAPERIEPPDPSRPDYDIRADVWSLGISLVELATGVFPYRDCQNDFEVLSRVIKDDPPKLPDSNEFTPDFKSFVSQCLRKNYRQRPKYAKLLEHPFVVKSSRSCVSVGTWYSSIFGTSGGMGAVTSEATPPVTPQPVRSFRTGSSVNYWQNDQLTPTPARARWCNTNSIFTASGSSSQPASLEAEYSSLSPFPRRRTLEECASPPPPIRRVSVDNRFRLSPQSSGNTSPIVLQRFYHQNQQRRSRADLHSTIRHRSLSREHSTGRSPEPPPRSHRQHHMLGHDLNGSLDLDPPSLHERLYPPSPLLLSERLSEGRSQSLTRVEPRNGYRTELKANIQPPQKHHNDDQSWLHSLAGLVKRRLGSVKWHHVAGRRDHHATTDNHQTNHLHHRGNNGAECRSVPGSPRPPRAPPAPPGTPRRQDLH